MKPTASTWCLDAVSRPGFTPQVFTIPDSLTPAAGAPVHPCHMWGATLAAGSGFCSCASARHQPGPPAPARPHLGPAPPPVHLRTAGLTPVISLPCSTQAQGRVQPRTRTSRARALQLLANQIRLLLSLSSTIAPTRSSSLQLCTACLAQPNPLRCAHQERACSWP